MPLVKVEPTQKGIAKALKRWATLRAKRAGIEAERERAIEPHRARFERRCAPIVARAAERLRPVEEELGALEKEITLAFLSALDERGNLKFTHVACATAVAEAITREERELDPQLFFNSVPPDQRNSAFYSCFKTLIGRAEEFLGRKRLNELAHAKRTHRVSINGL